MSEIEVPESPRSLNSRLAASRSTERIRRPAERVARAACFGSVAPGVDTDSGGMIVSRVICMPYKQRNQETVFKAAAFLPRGISRSFDGNGTANAGLRPKTANNPCLGDQNPYKARHPWVPAGS